MPLDTSIPLAGIGRRSSFLDDFGQAAQAAEYLQQRDIRREQAQQQQVAGARRQQAEGVLGKYTTPDGGIDWKQARPEMMRIEPKLAMEYDKYFGEQEKEKIQTEKLVSENQALVNKAQRSKLIDVDTYIGDLDLTKPEGLAGYASRRAIAKMYGMPDEYLPENATPEYLSGLQQAARRAKEAQSNELMDALKTQLLGAQTAGAGLDIMIKRTELERKKREEEQKAQQQATGAAGQAAKSKMIEAKLGQLEQQLKSSGILGATGPLQNLWAKINTASGAADRQSIFNFIKDNLTLDNLINIKSRGATFGALSDSEREAIANAAARLDFAGSEKRNLEAIQEIRELYFKDLQLKEQAPAGAQPAPAQKDPLGIR